MKDYLMFGRIHTAALTMPLFILGYVAANGSFWSLNTFYWALFGVIFHFNGMMVNNILDLRYDRKDLGKQHFPLVAGRISKREGYILLVYGHVIGVIAIFLLSLGTLSWIIGLSFIFFGWLYNWECKTHPLRAPLWNCLTTMLVPIFSFYSTTAQTNIYGVLLFLYVFLLAVFQTGHEGSLKDIESDRRNLIKLLGARIRKSEYNYENPVFYPGWSLLTGVSVRSAMFLVALIIAWGSLISFFSAFILGGGMVALSYTLLRRQKWDHRETLKKLAFNEIIMYFTLLASFIWLLGPLPVILLVVTMVAWFVLWNRLYWGTLLTPVV